MSKHEFAANCYQAGIIHNEILKKGYVGGVCEHIPRDVKSREFAEWLAKQLQRAMVNGMLATGGGEWD